ncbi:MAG: DUF3866 family protein [Capsulimonadaceae bacterium]|nr:DUF3866 family protein [Capsulimonadaceae bacterium]
MLHRATGTVNSAKDLDSSLQEIVTEFGPALNFVDLTGRVVPESRVVLNRTAATLGLGTGGYDFVMAVLGADAAPPAFDGHIIKARYTPVQHAVLTLEEQPVYKDVWDRTLDGFPVIVGQIHSQLAPITAALAQSAARVAYIMSDAAALPIGLSRLVRALKAAGWLAWTITAGQAFGADYETVTVASALIAARYILQCDVAVVIQGPGNAGTGTKYGFGGLEQAAHLNTASALGGAPIAAVRMSRADGRPRHQGISHHSRTALDATLAPCAVPIPTGTAFTGLAERHYLREMDGAAEVVAHMASSGIAVTTMGRGPSQDPLFFESAAAAGLYAASLVRERREMVR